MWTLPEWSRFTSRVPPSPWPTVTSVSGTGSVHRPVVEDSRPRCHTAGTRRSAHRAVSRTGTGVPAAEGDEDLEPAVEDIALPRPPAVACQLFRPMGEEVGKAGDPEQAVGPGVVAELELEVGHRAPRCR